MGAQTHAENTISCTRKLVLSRSARMTISSYNDPQNDPKRKNKFLFSRFREFSWIALSRSKETRNPVRLLPDFTIANRNRESHSYCFFCVRPVFVEVRDMSGRRFWSNSFRMRLYSSAQLSSRSKP